MIGFFAGNVLPNLIWKMEWKQKTLASFYLIRSFAGKDISGGAYFLEVLRRRGGFFLLLFLCGFTIFGVPLTVAYMLFLGMETGMILALSVLEFGIYGSVAGAGLLMPQYLIYIPAYFYLASIVYRQSYGIWKNYGLVPQKSGAYFRQGITVFSAVYRGNPCRKFFEPLYRRKSYKGPENFLRKISTISSNGFHKSAIFGSLCRKVLKLCGFTMKNCLILCKIHSIIQS